MTILIVVVLFGNNLAKVELPVWPEVREISKIYNVEVKRQPLSWLFLGKVRTKAEVLLDSSLTLLFHTLGIQVLITSCSSDTRPINGCRATALHIFLHHSHTGSWMCPAFHILLLISLFYLSQCFRRASQWLFLYSLTTSFRAVLLLHLLLKWWKILILIINPYSF